VVREQAGLTVALERPLARIRHAYTHFRIEMDGFLCRWTGGHVQLHGPVEHRWVTAAALTDYPLHKANHKLLPHLFDAL
jgi:A/G-specific adenine glycosylase